MPGCHQAVTISEIKLACQMPHFVVDNQDDRSSYENLKHLGTPASCDEGRYQICWPAAIQLFKRENHHVTILNNAWDTQPILLSIDWKLRNRVEIFHEIFHTFACADNRRINTVVTRLFGDSARLVIGIWGINML